MISRFDVNTEFVTQERCHIVEIHNNDKDPKCSVARARVEPGVTTSLHKLTGIIERYVILSGQGEVMIAGEGPVAVCEMDVVVIGDGQTQKITNTGDQDLVFICICTPRFRQERYVQLE
ncbi:MAG TPA: cupin domain-containing protein [Gammaproteobacteria bacterium]|nr:cupin domain-containing protein [Gammaproteobacteria bacterium]